MDFGLIVYQFHKLWWAVYFKEERKPYFQALDCKYVYLCVYSWDVYIFLEEEFIYIILLKSLLTKSEVDWMGTVALYCLMTGTYFFLGI